MPLRTGAPNFVAVWPVFSGLFSCSLSELEDGNGISMDCPTCDIYKPFYFVSNYIPAKNDL